MWQKLFEHDLCHESAELKRRKTAAYNHSGRDNLASLKNRHGFIRKRAKPIDPAIRDRSFRLEAYTGELELLYWTLVQYTVESA